MMYGGDFAVPVPPAVTSHSIGLYFGRAGLPVSLRPGFMPQSICGYSERFIELNWLHFALLFRFRDGR
jgi:hypothetical protein